MHNHIPPPYSAEQLGNLTEYQKDFGHAYRCNAGGHHNVLEVFEGGLRCPACGKVQPWAHRFVLDGVYRKVPPTPDPHNTQQLPDNT
jgi:hypothetical protein